MVKSLVKEIRGGEVYEYMPLGEHVVSAPGVCRGRPTFKYTSIEMAGILQQLGAGHSINELVDGYQGRISREAVQEAPSLAAKALESQPYKPGSTE